MGWHLGFIALSYFICLQINRLVFSYWPEQLVDAPLIGYPLFYGFDINRLFLFHYSELICVPLMAWVLCHQLMPLLGLSRPKQIPLKPLPSLPWADSLRLACVGFFLGRFFVPLQGSTWTACLVAAFIYPTCIWGASRFLSQRTSRSFAWWKSALNLFTIPFCVVALYKVSSQSHVVLDGALLPTPWLSGWLALGLFLALAGLCVSRLFENGKLVEESRLQGRELAVLIAVLSPLALFLPTPAAQPLVRDLFHTGESVVPATLLLNGWVPWRDFLFVHGLGEDVLQNVPGMVRWGGLWGGQNGLTLWIWPLAMASLGLFYQRFLRENLAALCLVLLMLVAPLKQIGPPLQIRFLLVPLTLFLSVRFFARPTFQRALAFAALTVLGLFSTGETFFFALGYGAMVVIADIQAGEFRRTLSYGGLSVGFILLGFGILSYFGALTPFLDFHFKTASGHRYTGGFPVQSLEATYYLLNLVSVASALAYGLNCWKWKKKLTPEELTAGALTLFAFFYYQKFLSRPDQSHFLIYWIPVQALFFYILTRALTWADRYWRRPISFALLCILLMCRWPYLAEAYDKLQARPALSTNAFDTTLGPFDFQAGVQERAEALRVFFEQKNYDGPVFDFSNQPLVTHYLLGLPPATRFPYVSLAIHPRLQEEVVRDLARSRPRFVVYAKKRSMEEQGAWDAIHNQVRHYRVTQYLLENYRPVAWVGATLILERADIAQNAMPWKEAARPLAHCNWENVLALRAKAYEKVTDQTPSLSKFEPSGLSTEIPFAIPATSRSHDLEIYFESLNDDNVVIETPAGSIEWKTKAGKKRVYLVPVGSCPQWYALTSGQITLRHSHPLQVDKVQWGAVP